MPIKRKFMIGVRKKTAKTAIHLNAGFIYSGEVNLRLFYAKVPSRTYTFQTSISHMLEFWFNPQITITKKIALLLVIMLVTAALYLLEPLKLDAILMFLAAGLVFFNLSLLQNSFYCPTSNRLVSTTIDLDSTGVVTRTHFYTDSTR